jgi:hypothetical protein
MRTALSEEKFSRTEWSRSWQVTDDDALHGAAVKTRQDQGQACRARQRESIPVIWPTVITVQSLPGKARQGYAGDAVGG